MSQSKFLLTAASMVLFLLSSIWADNNKSDIVITPKAYGALEVGQIGEGYFYASAGNGTTLPLTHVWQQRAYGYMGFDAQYKNNLKLNFTGGGVTTFSTPQVGTEPQTMQTRTSFYVNSAFAEYTFGDVAQPVLKLQVGYFPYKYNPDVRNLGEYMFRTNTYPLIVYSDFDYPQVNLMGLRANVKLFNNILENDFILNSELLGVPVQDWTISDIVSANFKGIVSIGAGISFCHYLNVYQGEYPSGWIDNYYNTDKPGVRPSFMLRDSLDSALFDWKAIKTMARISVDPKKLLPAVGLELADIFGENDLKIYGECNIVGLKNFPQYYTKLEDRMLTSFGINIPCFTIFDLVNLELEYCHNNSAFSDAHFFGAPTLTANTVVPLNPYDPNDPSTSTAYTLNREPWRWSIYVKKSILDGHVSFIGQAARDHKKINFNYFTKQYMSFIETLPTKSDWWWAFKTEFCF
jgi:hypothetical protein